jgi:rfaE bifunctional protein nucleotidyltransferase chain/domain
LLKDKIIPRAALRSTVRALRLRGKRIVFTNGCFDILHYGHVRYLERAASFGDVLVVGLNSDSSVRAIKGRNRPVNHQADRAAVLAALESVDYVTIFSEETPLQLISFLQPDVLVKGADWKKKAIVGAAFVRSRKGKVVTVPLERGRSTSGMIERICRAYR